MDIEQAVRDYIPQIAHMSLGTSKDNRPWVCEVHFAYDQELNLYFRSSPSRRHSQEIAANPYVAGNIVTQHPLHAAPRGVYFEGQAKLLAPGPKQNKAFECLKERIGYTDNSALEEAKDPEGSQFYKISVDTFYAFGKFGSDPMQKYELKWHGANSGQ